MESENKKKKPKVKPLGPIARITREFLGISLWTYMIVKLFIFDIDIYLINKYTPQALAIVDYKFFVFIALLLVCTVMFSFKVPRAVLLWAISYPIILCVWHIPRLAWSQWPLMVALLPSFHTAITDFRANLIRYGLGILAAFTICVSKTPLFLIPSMVVLAALFLVHLARCMKTAHQSNFFVRLTELIDKQTEKIEQDSWGDSLNTYSQESPENLEPEELEKSQNQLRFLLYCFRSIPDIVATNLNRVHRSEQLQVYMLLTLLYTIVLLIIVYAFQFWGLSKISSAAFSGQYSHTFFEFFTLSVTNIIPSGSLTTLSPATSIARAISLSQLGCWVFVFLILLSHLTTTAREKTKEDIVWFVGSLQKFAVSIEGEISKRLQMTVLQLEETLAHSDSKLIVNWLIKKQGREEITFEETEETKSNANTSELPQKSIVVTKEVLSSSTSDSTEQEAQSDAAAFIEQPGHGADSNGRKESN